MAESSQLMRVRLQKGRHLVKRGEIWYLETCSDARQRRRSLGTSDFEQATRLAASVVGGGSKPKEADISILDMLGPIRPPSPTHPSGRLSVFLILLAIGRGKAHGYGIMREVERLSGGTVRMGPGTLYRTIRRLCSEGLVEELGPGRRVAGDTRRKDYRLSPNGLVAFKREARLLHELLSAAMSRGLVTPG